MANGNLGTHFGMGRKLCAVFINDIEHVATHLSCVSKTEKGQYVTTGNTSQGTIYPLGASKLRFLIAQKRHYRCRRS